jgi:hypothetical protein
MSGFESLVDIQKEYGAVPLECQQEDGYRASHGLRTGTCVAEKSETLRETMVRL